MMKPMYPTGAPSFRFLQVRHAKYAMMRTPTTIWARDQRVDADDPEGVQPEEHRDEGRDEGPGEEDEPPALVVYLRHRPQARRAHRLHDKGVDELVGAARDQDEGEDRDPEDEEDVGLEERGVRVAQAQGDKDDPERHERRHLRIEDREPGRQDPRDGTCSARRACRGGTGWRR